MKPAHYILTTNGPDTVGIVAAVATFLAERGVFITESSHYGDPDSGRFFMRNVFRGADDRFPGIEVLRSRFGTVANRFSMQWSIVPTDARPRTMIAVSKAGHCLNHLLYLWQSDELPIDVIGVIGNHDDLRRLVEWHGIPFHHLPVDPNDKPTQQRAFLEVVDEARADLVVLARYMQILSPAMCAALSGRCINIHHSFLPSFKGARPYHQAHARGVKVIGATAHYVTTDLDEGPIIEQQTAHVDHTLTAEDLTRIGKEIESSVLARAVRWHAERRVLINGQRTIVFRHGG